MGIKSKCINGLGNPNTACSLAWKENISCQLAAPNPHKGELSFYTANTVVLGTEVGMAFSTRGSLRTVIYSSLMSLGSDRQSPIVCFQPVFRWLCNAETQCGQPSHVSLLSNPGIWSNWWSWYLCKFIGGVKTLLWFQETQGRTRKSEKEDPVFSPQGSELQHQL